MGVTDQRALHTDGQHHQAVDERVAAELRFFGAADEQQRDRKTERAEHPWSTLVMNAAARVSLTDARCRRCGPARAQA